MSTKLSVELLEDPHEKEVNELAAMLDLRKVRGKGGGEGGGGGGRGEERGSGGGEGGGEGGGGGGRRRGEERLGWGEERWRRREVS